MYSNNKISIPFKTSVKPTPRGWEGELSSFMNGDTSEIFGLNSFGEFYIFGSAKIFQVHRRRSEFESAGANWNVRGL